MLNKNKKLPFSKGEFPLFLPLFLFLLILPSKTLLGKETEEKRGPEFSKSVSGDIYAQIQVIGDVDGDGQKDLVFGATDGKVHLFGANGKEITAGLWPKFTGGPITAPVSVADLDGDGTDEVLTAGYDHKIYALDRFGRELWKFDAGGAIHLSQPRVVTMDKNSNQSMVVFGSHGKKIFSLDPKSGQLLWEVRGDATFSSSVETSDLEGDGKKEIIAKDDDGKIHVLTSTGSKTPGWPKATVRNGHWPFEVGITDLDNDGEKEILATDPERNLLIWNRQGDQVKTMKMTGQAHSAPRIADVDGDGKPDFIYGDHQGNINVVNQEGKSLPGFPYTLVKEGNHYIYGAPQLADVDGDGEPDLIYTAFDPNGKGEKAGYVHALSLKGKKIEGYPRFIGRSLAPVTIADLNGDGYLEIIAAGGIGYTDKQLHVFQTSGKIPIKIAIMGSEVTYD